MMLHASHILLAAETQTTAALVSSTVMNVTRVVITRVTVCVCMASTYLLPGMDVMRYCELRYLYDTHTQAATLYSYAVIRHHLARAESKCRV